MVPLFSARHGLPISSSLALVCLRFPVAPQGSAASSEPMRGLLVLQPARLSKCLPRFQFLYFHLSSLEPLAVFFQPISPCPFLAVSPASVDCAYSFVIPGTGDTEQSCVSNQCWAPRQARPRLQFKVAGPGLDAGGRTLPELFIMSPGLRSFSQYLTFFLCLVTCSPSSVMNLFHHCPLGHVRLPRKVGSCFVVYGSCPGMVSSNRVTSF